jgi:hypothetical protein
LLVEEDLGLAQRVADGGEAVPVTASGTPTVAAHSADHTMSQKESPLS